MSQPVNKLIVIIPALNEERTIKGVIESIPAQINGIGSIETIVIDDGSTDQTVNYAKSAGAHVVSHMQSLGVGAALQSGFRHALEQGADVIVNIDADGQFDSADIPKLLQPILDQKVWFVTCSRFADHKLLPKMPGIKIWGNRWMTRIINFITGKKFTDVSCGFRAYTREVALRLILFGRFTYTQETFIDLAFKGIPMAEVPLKVRGQRQYGRSRVAGNLWLFAAKSSSIIFRAARDYHPLKFFGLPGLLLLLIGGAGGLFLLYHWSQTGQTSPYRSLVQVSGVLIIVGVLLLFLSMIADMLHRNRLLVEETLYLARKKAYAKQGDDTGQN